MLGERNLSSALLFGRKLTCRPLSNFPLVYRKSHNTCIGGKVGKGCVLPRPGRFWSRGRVHATFTRCGIYVISGRIADIEYHMPLCSKARVRGVCVNFNRAVIWRNIDITQERQQIRNRGKYGSP